jgi:hypothetical protein
VCFLLSLKDACAAIETFFYSFTNKFLRNNENTIIDLATVKKRKIIYYFISNLDMSTVGIKKKEASSRLMKHKQCCLVAVLNLHREAF